MTSRRWWNVAAVLAVLLLLVCRSAHAQLACPEIAGDMVLVHDSSPDGMGRITGQVKDGYGGQKLFHCLYRNHDRAARNRIGDGTVSVTWVPPDATGPGRTSWKSCGQPRSHLASASSGYGGSISSASRMATVTYSVSSAVGYDSRSAPLRDVAAQLLEHAEALGAPCAPVVPAPPSTSTSVAVDENNPTPPPGLVVGRIVGFMGVVEVLPEGKGDGWRQVGLNTPLVTGDVIRTGPGARARLEFADKDLTAGAGPSVINMSSDSEMAIDQFVVSFQEPKVRVGVFELIKGVVRAATKGWRGSSGFSVRSGATVCGIRGTDVVIAYDPQRDQVAWFLNEGQAEIRRGSERHDLAAGQMVAVHGGVFQPVRPLEPANWERLVAAVAVPAAPAAPWTDVTLRRFPVGVLPRGGETWLVGDTYVVQSADALMTSQDISTRALEEFRAVTDVRIDNAMMKGAGFYLSTATDAAGRHGDLAFVTGPRGPVVTYREQDVWRDLPLLQTRGPATSVRLEVVCRSGGQYELRWDGELLAKHTGKPGPMRVLLLAAAGTKAEFSRFSVTAPATSADAAAGAAIPPARPEPRACGWVFTEGVLGQGSGTRTCMCSGREYRGSEAVTMCGRPPE